MAKGTDSTDTEMYFNTSLTLSSSFSTTESHTSRDGFKDPTADETEGRTSHNCPWMKHQSSFIYHHTLNIHKQRS